MAGRTGFRAAFRRAGMTGPRSALHRLREDGVPARAPRIRGRNGWRPAWSGTLRIAFRRPGCGEGAGPAFPGRWLGTGER